MGEEIWKDVVGYEGLYEVSSFGQVKNTRTGKIIGRNYVRNGYWAVTLSKDSIKTTYSRHRLAAMAFIENPNNLPCVNHKDCNRLNSHISNLEWVSHAENTHHAVGMGRFDVITGENSPFSKVKEKDILEVVRLLKQGHTPCHISRVTGINRLLCDKVNRGVTWKKYLKQIGLTKFPIFKNTFEHQIRVKPEQVTHLRQLLLSGLSQQKIGDILGVAQTTVSRAVKRYNLRGI